MTNSNSFSLLMLFLFATLAVGQDQPTPEPLPTPAKITTEQITFLEAESAEVYQKEECVEVVVQGLKGATGQAVRVSVPARYKAEKIDVVRLVKIDGLTFAVWPPKEEKPVRVDDDAAVFHVAGEPGDMFGVTVRGAMSAELTVKIEGGNNPPVPIPDDGPDDQDLASVKAIAKNAAESLDDPVTQQAIAAKIRAIQWPDSLDEATEALQEAVSQALTESMAEIDPPYKDWFGKFRQPLNSKIVELESAGKVSNAESLKKLAAAITEGLESVEESVTSTWSLPKVTMYSRPSCSICSLWEKTIWPMLEQSNWEVEKKLQPNGDVPRFEICVNGKCLTHTGFMSVADFNKLVKAVK